jgi:aldehyde:ferredoxin oxidoreductase
MDRRRREYYEAMGWDENGIPRSEVLGRLNLQDVDRALDKIR